MDYLNIPFQKNKKKKPKIHNDYLVLEEIKDYKKEERKVF